MRTGYYTNAPRIALFNITTPYPGTQMFERARRNGYRRTLEWNDYDLANSVIELPTVSGEEINRMYKVAYHEFYFRPSYLVRRMTRMRSWDDIVCNVRALRSVMFTKTPGPNRSAPPPGVDLHSRSCPKPTCRPCAGGGSDVPPAGLGLGFEDEQARRGR